jgi:hypothetical protein
MGVLAPWTLIVPIIQEAPAVDTVRSASHVAGHYLNAGDALRTKTCVARRMAGRALMLTTLRFDINHCRGQCHHADGWR